MELGIPEEVHDDATELGSFAIEGIEMNLDDIERIAVDVAECVDEIAILGTTVLDLAPLGAIMNDN